MLIDSLLGRIVFVSLLKVKAYSDRLVDNCENLLCNSNYVIAHHRGNF